MKATVRIYGGVEVVEVQTGTVFEVLQTVLAQIDVDPIVPEEWEVRDSNGAPLEWSSLVPAETIFVARKPGIGG